MSKYDKAITYFEEAIRESDEIIAESSPRLKAELIEQKEHFLTALSALSEQANRWIPVIQRLPEEYTMVLAWEGDYAFRAEHVDGKWYEATHEPAYQSNITHWRPLPEGPKEVKP